MHIEKLQESFGSLSESIRKALINSGFFFSDYVIRFLLVAITTSFVARYLGPKQFGVLNYASALVLMATSFSALGTQGLQMNSYSQPALDRRKFHIFFTLRFLGSVLALLVLLVFAIWFVRDEVVRRMLFVLALTPVFQMYENIESLFIAKNYVKTVVIVKLLPFLIFSAVKIVAVYLQASLMFFALIQVLELFGLFIFLLIALGKKFDLMPKFVFDWQETKKILFVTSPMIVSSVALLIQSRLDQVIIGALVSQTGAGYYSAAFRLSELINFIPIIIHSSVIAHVLQSYHQNEESFSLQLQSLYRAMFVVMALICIAASLAAPLAMYLFFGKEFLPGWSILAILIWSKLFSSLRMVKEIYITAKGYYAYLMVAFLVGMGVNIVGNFIVLSLHLGLAWYAWVAVITQLITLISFDFFFPKMKRHMNLLVDSVATFWRIHVVFRPVKR